MNDPLKAASQPAHIFAQDSHHTKRDDSRPAKPHLAATRSVPGYRRATDDPADDHWYWNNAQGAFPALDVDGLLFEQLLGDSSSSEQNSGQAQSGGLATLTAPTSGTETSELASSLTEQLPSQPSGPFTATLLMPSLGKIYMKAQKNSSHWAIGLSFDREDAMQRVQAHKGDCERTLSENLGHEVRLSIDIA